MRIALAVLMARTTLPGGRLDVGDGGMRAAALVIGTRTGRLP
ncbi:MAG: hypothetical protein ACREOC_00205 [Gemmatimonadales bacterium]